MVNDSCESVTSACACAAIWKLLEANYHGTKLTGPAKKKHQGLATINGWLWDIATSREPVLKLNVGADAGMICWGICQ